MKPPELPDNVTLEVADNNEAESFVLEQLIAYNETQVGPINVQPLSVLLRDEEGNIIGGLISFTQWHWLFVRLLWVAESHRGKGLGRSMMLQAEKEALARGCDHIYLDTFSFQARGFYEGLGYKVCGEIVGLPAGHSRYYLSKSLK